MTKIRWDTVAVDDAQMRCYLGLPVGDGPFPGVIVCMHAPGIDPFIQDMGQRLADAGFVALAPDLYHRDPHPDDEPLQRMGRLRDAELLQDLRAATRRLRELPEVRPERTATLGFCMGGRIAYLHASDDPALRLAVAFYPGNTRVAWGEGASPFERSERIACPVLGFFGAEDTNPSPEDMAKIDRELTRLGKPHELHSYAGAGHAFLNHYRPSYRAQAAADAWEKALSSLRRHLV